MSQTFPQYSYYEKIAYEFDRLVEMRGSNSIFQMTINDCVKQEQSGIGSAGGSSNNQGGTMNYYSCDDTNPYTYLYYKRNRIQNVLKYLKSCRQSIDTVSVEYKELMAYLYQGTLINHQLNPAYHLCLDTLRKVGDNQFALVWDFCYYCRPVRRIEIICLSMSLFLLGCLLVRSAGLL